MTHPFIGTWRSDINPHAFLTFTDDHRVNGSDGINKLRTSWTDDGEIVSVTPAVTTLMAVRNLQAWVTSVRTVEIREDSLVAYDAQHRELGTLRRESASTTE